MAETGKKSGFFDDATEPEPKPETPPDSLTFPVWDESVRLPPMPSVEDLKQVYRHLGGLAKMDLRIKFAEENAVMMRPQPENPFALLEFALPLKNNRGERLNDFPDICYFIEDPFILAESGLAIRKRLSVQELIFAMNNPADWNGFWGTAVRGLEAWGNDYETLCLLDDKARKIWPEIPEHSVSGFWLAQMALIWMKYGHVYFMKRKNDMFEGDEGTRYLTRRIWDPVQAMGEWGASYIRAWSAGFFDTIWYYRLQKTPPDEKCLHEMQVSMRIIKGRYLMLLRENTKYEVNPTYNEEYMTVM